MDIDSKFSIDVYSHIFLASASLKLLSSNSLIAVFKA